MINKLICAVLLMVVSSGCTSPSVSPPPADAVAESRTIIWTVIKAAEVDALNADLQAGKPTVDVGLYYPSNLHEDARAILPLEGLLEEFANAKRVFAPTGVQLNLLWVKTGAVDPGFLAINSASDRSQMPSGGYGNMYVQRSQTPSELSDGALAAFDGIIEPAEDNSRTVYLLALQNVYMTFFENLDDTGRNWAPKVVNTSGLSFPSYMYGGSIPDRIRGVITLTKHDSENKLTIAHELGHKLINVSHEYMTIGPQHEIRSDHGLMLYGSGTQIPSGKEGRWHQERLLLSPYLYRLEKTGKRIWNSDYEAGGFYYDPLYGDYTIAFD